MELEEVSALPLPWLFCSDICRGKLSSQNPSEIRIFLTAGNTVGKISLVQITATYFGMGGFLHGTFETIIVWTRFSGKFHTFSALPDCKSFLLSYRSCTTVRYAKAHIHTVAIVEKDNPIFLLTDVFTHTKAAGAKKASAAFCAM